MPAHTGQWLTLAGELIGHAPPPVLRATSPKGEDLPAIGHQDPAYVPATLNVAWARATGLPSALTVQSA